MSYYSPSIEKLIENFEKLPSIGHKTATRLAFHILDQSNEETKNFISAIINAKNNLKYCTDKPHQIHLKKKKKKHQLRSVQTRSHCTT